MKDPRRRSISASARWSRGHALLRRAPHARRDRRAPRRPGAAHSRRGRRVVRAHARRRSACSSGRSASARRCRSSGCAPSDAAAPADAVPRRAAAHALVVRRSRRVVRAHAALDSRGCSRARSSRSSVLLFVAYFGVLAARWDEFSRPVAQLYSLANITLGTVVVLWVTGARRHPRARARPRLRVQALRRRSARVGLHAHLLPARVLLQRLRRVELSRASRTGCGSPPLEAGSSS